jgi:hypothetical protein
MLSSVETTRKVPPGTTQLDMAYVRREQPDLLTAAVAEKGHVD